MSRLRGWRVFAKYLCVWSGVGRSCGGRSQPENVHSAQSGSWATVPSSGALGKCQGNLQAIEP